MSATEQEHTDQKALITSYTSYKNMIGNVPTPNTPNTQKMFRLTHKDNKHHGMTYKEGLNEDPLPFVYEIVGHASVPGGMYFFTGDQLFEWRTYTNNCYWIWDVELPGSKVHHEYGKSKTDKFILSNKRRFYGDETVWKALGITTENDRINFLKTHSDSIRYIYNPTSGERLAAVTNDGRAIRYIKNPTQEERLTAVKHNGEAIEFIDDPTHEERLAAIAQDGCSILFIDDPTPEERLAAVKQSGYAIEYICGPTEEECIAAIAQNKRVASFIEDNLSPINMIQQIVSNM